MKCELKIKSINDTGEETFTVCGEESPSKTNNIPTCRKCRARVAAEKNELLGDTKKSMTYAELLALTKYREFLKNNKDPDLKRKVDRKLMKKELKRTLDIDKWGYGVEKLKFVTKLKEMDEQQTRDSRAKRNDKKSETTVQPSNEGEPQTKV